MAKYVLVMWVGEETLSVMPSATIRSDHKLFVGTCAEFKWRGKYYEAEVLELSG